MNPATDLTEVLMENRSAKLIEDHIYSVLPDASRFHHYDKRATAYDFIVSTRLYNLSLWGSSPSEYVSFARQAVTSADDGIFLDAGCGSLLFTAPLYLNSHRRIIAFDQSLAMLRRARQRLIRLAGAVPEHIRLLQADLTDLPFRSNTFRTLLCLNVLHQFADAATLISNFKNLLTRDGSLYLSSLVLNDRFVGDWYLKALYATGEFVRPRSVHEIKEMFDKDARAHVKGNMAYLSTDKIMVTI